MKTLKFFMIILLPIILIGSASAQKKGTDKILPNPPKTVKKADSIQPNSGMLVSPDYLYNSVLIVMKNGDTKNGFFVGVDTANIYMLVKGIKETVNFNDLSYVKLGKSRKLSMHGLTGMLWGLYLGNVIFYQADNQPTAFLRSSRDDEFEFVVYNLAYAAAGMGIGYLMGAIFDTKTTTYNFNDEGNSAINEFNRLRSAISKTSVESKFHFSVYTAKTSVGANDDYTDMLRQVGMNPKDYNDYGIYYYSYSSYSQSITQSNINLLRKMQFSYSFFDNVDFGISFMWLGSPNIYANKTGNTINQVNTSFLAKGYYGTVIYAPLRKYLPDNFALNLGFGIGWANVNYSAKYSFDSTFNINNVTKHLYDNRTAEIEKSRFSSHFYGEFNILFSSTTSLGLNYEYTYVAPIEMPKMGILRRISLSPGGSSFGLTLGINY